MIIRHKKSFVLGIILTFSFFILLFLIFLPIFGEGKNGLEFADEMFNKLAKGSSYFIPEVIKSNEKFIGKTFTTSIRLDTPEDAEKTAKLFTIAGAMVEVKGAELKIAGDLGKTLNGALQDADVMYHNKGAEISGLYGYDEKAVMKNWWQALSQMEKTFEKEKMIAEAKIVSDVKKKAIETAYNYYNIDAVKIKDKIGLTTFMLTFYVGYTIWWGFAVLYLLDGLGLSAKKAKVRKEV